MSGTARKHEWRAGKGHARDASPHRHNHTREEARLAGHKGGKRLSENRAHMAEIGRNGGLRAARNAPMRVWAALEDEDRLW